MARGAAQTTPAVGAGAIDHDAAVLSRKVSIRARGPSGTADSRIADAASTAASGSRGVAAGTAQSAASTTPSADDSRGRAAIAALRDIVEQGDVAHRHIGLSADEQGAAETGAAAAAMAARSALRGHLADGEVVDRHRAREDEEGAVAIGGAVRAGEGEVVAVDRDDFA
jgi:hypothetical protein